MAAFANVVLTDTFDIWRIRTNDTLARLNQISVSNSAIFSNTVTANVQLNVLGGANVAGVFQVDTGSANTNIFSDNLNVTSNTQIGGTVLLRGATTLSSSIQVSGTAALQGQTNVGARFTVDDNVSNTNIYSDHFNVTANASLSGTLGVTGQTTLSNVVAMTVSSGAANTNVFSDHMNVTANTNMAGTVTLAGLNTTATDIAGAVNEVKTTADGAVDEALAFAIALG